MSNQTHTPKLSTLISQANGWDTVHNVSHPLYGKVVVSPVVKTMMTELNMHWLVSDLLVSLRMKRNLRAADLLVVKWNAKLGRIQVRDYDTDKVLYTQKYDSHNADEDFDLIVSPWHGDPSFRLIYAIGED